MPNRTQGNERTNSKLTSDKVIAARKLYNEGFTIREIALAAGVSETSMRSAIIGCTWRHVTTEPPCRMRPAATKPLRMLTIADVTRPLRMWCKANKIPFRLAQQRLDAGWDPVDALTLPNLGKGGQPNRRFETAL